MINLPFSHTPYNDVNDFNLEENEGIYVDYKSNEIPIHVIADNSKILTIDQSYDLSFNTVFDFFERYYSSFQSSAPYMIVMPEGNFEHLRNIKYDKHFVDYLNNKGLHIYLQEPPTLIYNKKLNFKGDYIELDKTKLDSDFNSYNDVLFGTDKPPTACLEFDVLEEFVAENNLKNVTVYTNYYNLDQVFKNYSFIIKYFNIHWLVCSKAGNETTIISYNKTEKFPDPNLITHTFLTMSKKYIGFRELITAFVYGRSAQQSYIHKAIDFSVVIDYEEINSDNWDYFWKDFDKRLPFKFSSWKYTHPEKYNYIVKNLDIIKNNLYIDQKSNVDTFKDISDMDMSIVPLPAEIKNCFVQIVMESKFNIQFPYVCEKTMYPIKTYRPFILVSSPGSLELLKSNGFKTFSDYWDESYDREIDCEKRLLKILDIIENLSKLSIEECRSIYKDMETILTHNFNNLHKNLQ